MFAVARRGGRIAPAGRRGQGAGLGAVHRRRRLGRPGGPDRADRLRARARRSAGSLRVAERRMRRAGRLRRGRRHRGDVQRAAGRRVLRDGADPAATSPPSPSAWSCSPRSPRASSAAPPSATPPFLQLPAFTRRPPASSTLLFAVLGLLAGGVGVAVHPGAVRDRGRLRPACGAGRSGCARRSAASLLGAAAARAAADVRRGLPGARRRRRRAVRPRRSCSLLLVGKMVATSLTIGIGGSGGVFAPSLFIGAMLGAAFGDLAHAPAARRRRARSAPTG